MSVQFNRGKIPERVVHARGMTAKGYFEVSLHKLSDKLSCLVLSRSESKHHFRLRTSLLCTIVIFALHKPGLTLCLVCRQLMMSQISAQLSSCPKLVARLP